MNDDENEKLSDELDRDKLIYTEWMKRNVPEMAPRVIVTDRRTLTARLRAIPEEDWTEADIEEEVAARFRHYFPGRKAIVSKTETECADPQAWKQRIDEATEQTITKPIVKQEMAEVAEAYGVTFDQAAGIIGEWFIRQILFSAGIMRTDPLLAEAITYAEESLRRKTVDLIAHYYCLCEQCRKRAAGKSSSTVH